MEFLNNLNFQPALHRRSLYHKLERKTKNTVHRHFAAVAGALANTIDLTWDGTSAHPTPYIQPLNLALWKLLFLYEVLILSPPSQNDKLNRPGPYRNLVPS